MAYNVVGQRLPRADAAQQVTGSSKYVDDIERPGMLYGYVLRSEYAHANIKSIDTSDAEKFPGVKAVITHKDMPHNRFGVHVDDQPVLADDKVRHYGDAVAAVAAETLEIAEKASKLIKVGYEPIPGVFDIYEAMKENSPKVHGSSNLFRKVRIANGDVEKGFAEADFIVEDNFKTQRVEHAHIEPHVGFAEIAPNGDLIIEGALARPFTIAADLEKLLKIPMHRIQVITGPIGGAFGGKNEITTEPIMAILAMKTKRPVKIKFTREDEFISSTIRHPYYGKYRSGITKEGKIIAREVEIYADTGAYVAWGVSTLTKACVHCCGPYNIPNTLVNGYVVYTNNPISGAMRGFGVPQVGFAYEVHMDTIAERVGINPVELRLINVLRDNDFLPCGQEMPIVTSSETIEKALEIYNSRRGMK
jgi:CO/xanthine dehydrogenase Mo-binding subunit